jgi:hypothetical protein
MGSTGMFSQSTNKIRSGMGQRALSLPNIAESPLENNFDNISEVEDEEIKF